LFRLDKPDEAGQLANAAAAKMKPPLPNDEKHRLADNASPDELNLAGLLRSPMRQFAQRAAHLTASIVLAGGAHLRLGARVPRSRRFVARCDTRVAFAGAKGDSAPATLQG